MLKLVAKEQVTSENVVVVVVVVEVEVDVVTPNRNRPSPMFPKLVFQYFGTAGDPIADWT